jgi:hypothetical protein
MKTEIKMNSGNKKLINYILNSIDSSNYNIECKNDFEKLQFLYNTFVKEYCFQPQHKYSTQHFSEWLQGLPSSINIVFYYNEIEEKLREFDIINEKTPQRIIDGYLQNWFLRIAVNFLGLCRINKIIK